LPPLRDFQSRPFNRSGTSPDAFDRWAVPEGYDTGAPLVARLPAMLLAASAAVTKDIGLIATFIGIGIIVNIILVFVGVQVRGENQQNKEHLDS
jgi:hypothetical protein